MPASIFTVTLLLFGCVLTAGYTHQRHQPTGCIVNGTIYGEGSALVTSSHCEYCYCIKGRQHCVKPHCILKVQGCRPQYNSHSCCPIKYYCSNIRNSTVTSTTTISSLAHLTGSCKVNGSTYPEGEKIESPKDECKNCYCMKGKVRCEPTICPVPLDSCRPVITPGHCCPTSYNCSEVEPTNTEYSTKKDETTTAEYNETTVTTTFSPEKNDTEITTISIEETTETSTIEILANDTELRSGTESGFLYDDTTTVRPVTVEITTLLSEPTIVPETNTSNPIRSIPDVLEAIINRTLEKDEDYEYDYNEPSLPPSLPNLKIIPFVAADAVLNEQEEYSSRLEGKTEIPIYLDIPQPNRFSPPSKTEGGFVPRDPVIDGPFYESKFEKPFINHHEQQAEMTSETLLPPITEPPKLFEEGKCDRDGQTYHHGQVVSESNSCELCVCYYRQIHCQKPKCNPVKPGCKRVPDKKNSCCGREICGTSIDNPLILSDNIEAASLTTPILETMSNFPAITVADLIVTPNPFKDVIRTEPAPDLMDIMKDMLPHLMNDSSSVKPQQLDTISGIWNDSQPNLNDTKNIVTTTDNIPYSENKNLTSDKSDSFKQTLNSTKNNTSSFQDDYEDSFSLGSVLDMLFRGESSNSHPKTSAPPIATTLETHTIKNLYNIHTTDQKNDINNAIENSDTDYNNKKDKIAEKTSDLLVFNDYQADEARNETKEALDSEMESAEKSQTIISTEKSMSVDVSNKTMKDDLGSSLLKLAGCNIYGRMYRVGKIISELSGPCLECKCTEFGVQCRKLC